MYSRVILLCKFVLCLCTLGTHCMPPKRRRFIEIPVDLVQIHCGHETCDVTFQYCDRGILETRPVCMLCDGVCSAERVGSNTIQAKYCKRVCPVYWYQEQQRREETDAMATTGVPDVDARQNTTSTGYMTTILLSLITMFVTMSVVLLFTILCFLCKTRRGCKSKEKHIITPKKPVTGHINQKQKESKAEFRDTLLTSPLLHAREESRPCSTTLYCTNPTSSASSTVCLPERHSDIVPDSLSERHLEHNLSTMGSRMNGSVVLPKSLSSRLVNPSSVLGTMERVPSTKSQAIHNGQALLSLRGQTPLMLTSQAPSHGCTPHSSGSKTGVSSESRRELTTNKETLSSTARQSTPGSSRSQTSPTSKTLPEPSGSQKPEVTSGNSQAPPRAETHPGISQHSPSPPSVQTQPQTREQPTVTHSEEILAQASGQSTMPAAGRTPAPSGHQSTLSSSDLTHALHTLKPKTSKTSSRVTSNGHIKSYVGQEPLTGGSVHGSLHTQISSKAKTLEQSDTIPSSAPTDKPISCPEQSEQPESNGNQSKRPSYSRQSATATQTRGN